MNQDSDAGTIHVPTGSSTWTGAGLSAGAAPEQGSLGSFSLSVRGPERGGEPTDAGPRDSGEKEQRGSFRKKGKGSDSLFVLRGFLVKATLRSWQDSSLQSTSRHRST